MPCLLQRLFMCAKRKIIGEVSSKKTALRKGEGFTGKGLWDVVHIGNTEVEIVHG